MTAFDDRKAAAVLRAEEAYQKASDRLRAALESYDREVAIHEARGDGFFSKAYIKARREAVLARKGLESRRSALHTARAEQIAARLEGL